MSEPADEEWRAVYRKGWRERNEPWKRPPKESPPLSDAFLAHLDYLDRLIASIPGPLVLHDDAERAEWRKFSAHWDQVQAEVMRTAR